MFIWPPFLINLFSSVHSVEILAAAHPALGCDHGVISQSLVPRKEEGLSKKIPPWDATEASRRARSTAIETEVERGVIKCPLHFLQEALYNPLLFSTCGWILNSGHIFDQKFVKR